MANNADDDRVTLSRRELLKRVGFVGAAESKDELLTHSRGIPFLVVRGRLGGSAMVAAAVNALARPGV